MTKRSKTKKPRKTAEQIAAEHAARRELLEMEQLARRANDLRAVNVPAEAAILPRQVDIEVTRAGEQRAEAEDDKKVSHDTARRHDAFSALRAGMAAGCYDAARRFELDLLTRHGIADRAGRSLERVDCTGGHATDAIITAAQNVERVQDRIPPRDYWLLCELIIPAIDRGTWRDHVAYVTGERHTEGQSAAVRAATVNLRDAYAAMERRAAA